MDAKIVFSSFEQLKIQDVSFTDPIRPNVISISKENDFVFLQYIKDDLEKYTSYDPYNCFSQWAKQKCFIRIESTNLIVYFSTYSEDNSFPPVYSLLQDNTDIISFANPTGETAYYARAKVYTTEPDRRIVEAMYIDKTTGDLRLDYFSSDGVDAQTLPCKVFNEITIRNIPVYKFNYQYSSGIRYRSSNNHSFLMNLNDISSVKLTNEFTLFKGNDGLIFDKKF